MEREQREIKNISLYLHEEVLDELQERLDEITTDEISQRRTGRRSGAINTALRRYYALLRRARHALKTKFTQQEINLILDATNGVIWEPIESFLWLRHNIEDAIAFDGLDRKWGVEAESLIRKLDECTPLELAALVDATERFWHRCQELNLEEALEF